MVVTRGDLWSATGAAGEARAALGLVADLDGVRVESEGGRQGDAGGERGAGTIGVREELLEHRPGDVLLGVVVVVEGAAVDEGARPVAAPRIAKDFGTGAVAVEERHVGDGSATQSAPAAYEAIRGLRTRVVVLAELPCTRKTLLLRMLAIGRRLKEALADFRGAAGRRVRE
jgi:hypothetical protein